ncbi:putative transcription regulator [Thermoascus aurantiacus ATCC 26904]
MSCQPVTSLLLSTFTPVFERVITHPFLKLAGQGRISKQILSEWLSQDRLYAQAYLRFIGLLLSKIVIPPRNPDSAKLREPQTEERIFDVLVDALTNIQRELRFFEAVAVEFGLDLTALPREEEGWTVFGPNSVTRAYIDLFMSAGSPGASLLEGMCVLWATEYCYLRAWRYAKEQMERHGGEPSGKEDADGGALRLRFIPNWTSPEFEDFVTRLRDVVDEMGGKIKGAEEGERERGKCLGWWKQVLWAEERFWPEVEASS